MGLKMKTDVVIVGGGLFGRVAADACMLHGYDVVVIDNKEPLAGSPPAACLMRPSWMAGLGTKAREGLSTLDKIYGLTDVEFKLRVGSVTVHHVHPLRILRHGDGFVHYDTVTEVGNGYVMTRKGTKWQGKVLVAAGWWSQQLVKMPEIKPLLGKVAWYPMVKGHENRITMWAPYKQSVSFNYGKAQDGSPVETDNELVWFGDGTAILKDNWKPAHDARIKEHALEHGLKEANFLGFTAGIRPYVKGHSAGYFRKVFPNTWVSTGGGKNGLVLAGSQAAQFIKALRR